MMRHLDLFSGIGGFALATEWAWDGEEVEHIFCDNDPFAQAVLRKHWPHSKIYGDIREVTKAGIIADSTGIGLRGRSQDGPREQSSVHTAGVQSDATDATRTGRGERNEERRGVREGKGALGSEERRGFAHVRRHDQWAEDWPTVAARLCTLDDGLPNGLARPRGWRNAALKGAGNAIVPQVAYEILKAMRETNPS